MDIKITKEQYVEYLTLRCLAQNIEVKKLIDFRWDLLTMIQSGKYSDRILAIAKTTYSNILIRLKEEREELKKRIYELNS